jgi:AraC-like DNA-binding protein
MSKMAAGARVLAFDTDRLKPEERFDTWATGMTFYEVETSDRSAFRAALRAWLLPPVIIIDARTSDFRFHRTQDLIRGDAVDDVVLQWLATASATGDADGRAFSAAPGEILVHDRARPFEGRMSAGRYVAVSMPRTFLEEKLPAACVHGLVLRDGLAPPFGAFLEALVGILDEGDRDEAELARLLRDLLAAAIRRAIAPSEAEQADLALNLRAKRYIRGNLAQRLDVPTLCTALGVSRSSLYRAFEREGGVARTVTAERLKRLHRLLSNPEERAPIAQLAAANGFPDSAHFSRLFRRAFGYTPQALRRRSQTTAELVHDEDAPALYKRWEADKG